MKITPLESWVKQKTGGDLLAYQLEKLNETLAAAQKGPHYCRTLPAHIDSLTQLSSLPTVDATTLSQNSAGLVCVPQDEISRIVTLSTSGSTGTPKRLYFTQDDQELTVDYFANGLPTVAPVGGTMAILLPCERPGGVGDLIARALERIPVTPVRHGLISDLKSCVQMLIDSKADALVGVPTQVLAAARYCEALDIETKIRAVLLSTDNIPRIVVSELRRIWGCEVYEHYGMTEMGLGGAIDCDAHDGYHIRENDLLFEILDKNGDLLPEGVYGEVAFTTLTRRGMPLVRYRTGDISKIIPGQCACGSALKRIAPLAGRIGADVTMASGAIIKMRDFDEVLFSMQCISDFWLTASPHDNELKIDVDIKDNFKTPPEAEIKGLLHDSGLIDGLAVHISTALQQNTLTQRTGKRGIEVVSQIV